MAGIEDQILRKVEEFEGLIRQNKADRFSNYVAICVAIISAFLAFSSIKNGNVGQALQKAERERANYWNQYQAKRLRQFMLETKLADLNARLTDGTLTETPAFMAKVREWRETNDRYKFELRELAAQARAQEAFIATRLVQGDQLDIAEAFLALSLAMLAVAALTRIGWMLGIGFLVGSVGVFFGIATYLEWSWAHPEFLVQFFDA